MNLKTLKAAQRCSGINQKQIKQKVMERKH